MRETNIITLAHVYIGLAEAGGDYDIRYATRFLRSDVEQVFCSAQALKDIMATLTDEQHRIVRRTMKTGIAEIRTKWPDKNRKS